MDTEQYEEAVRDYEKVYQTEKTKGESQDSFTVAELTDIRAAFSSHAAPWYSIITFWCLVTIIALPHCVSIFPPAAVFVILLFFFFSFAR